MLPGAAVLPEGLTRDPDPKASRLPAAEQGVLEALAVTRAQLMAILEPWLQQWVQAPCLSYWEHGSHGSQCLGSHYHNREPGSPDSGNSS